MARTVPVRPAATVIAVSPTGRHQWGVFDSRFVWVVRVECFERFIGVFFRSGDPISARASLCR